VKRFITLFDDSDPQQIHIASVGDITDAGIIVSWVTKAQTGNSTVQYGTTSGSYSNSVTGDQYKFTDPNSTAVVRWNHDVVLRGLNWATTYYYRVGDQAANKWSAELQFTTLTNNGIVRMAVYGDMGVINSQSLDNLRSELTKKNLDMILHVGDFAYDLHTDNGAMGDQFMNELQPIAGQVPYMGCAGNHEGKFNFSHYNNRFSGWNYVGQAGAFGTTGQNWWYSWDYMSGGAKVHMTAVNTELYYTYVDEFPPVTYELSRKAQYEWLDKDLQIARDNGADWLVVYGHRPMYCSNTDDVPDCTTDAETLRVGWNNTGYGMEDIIHKHKVDFFFGAHEHSYERMFPVYNGQVDQQSNHTYVNPKFPVHIVTGAPGCQEYFDYYDDVFYGPWSAVRSSTYGYGHFIVHNKTHVYWDQLIDEGASPADTLWVVRD
jgi:hypothetical protein